MTETPESFSFEMLLSPEFAREPQPAYARMRETRPVIREEFNFFGDEGGTVLLSRHEDCEFALRNPQLFSSAFGVGPEALGNVRPLIPLQIDPPMHKKYRMLLDPLFSPHEMLPIEGEVTKLVNELLDAFADQGSCEFNQQFAVPLPCTVFLRLLGLPMEDLDLFLQMKEGIIRGNSDPDLARQREIRAEQGGRCYEYFAAIVDERRANPTDDILTKMLAFEIDGRPITKEEVLDVCFLFLIAGLDTVTDSLNCFYANLARNPGLRQRIVDDPAVIPAAVEELLRWETPVPIVARLATRDTEVRGCPVHQGDMVAVMLGSANTDEATIDRAGEVDFDRESNRHYAFGGGIHRCLGSNLARLELRVALREWHRRIPEYRIPDGVELEYTPMLRSIEHLPLEWAR